MSALLEAAPRFLAELRAFALHLRLPFQLLLAPIFLWGARFAGEGDMGALGLGFLLFHLPLYGGATVFNSYYDRDEGPIGGLKHPPAMVPWHLWFGLVLIATGALSARRLGPLFASVYVVLALLGLAYSHPAIRFKRRPWRSLLLVSLAQGGGGFLGGWLAHGGDVARLATPGAALALLAALLLPTGLYPLTQIYQVEEDRRRGDCTFAVRFGPQRVFRFAAVLLSLGAGVASAALLQFGAPFDALAVVLGALLSLVLLRRWRATFDANDAYAGHDAMFRIAGITSLAFGLLLLTRLLAPLFGVVDARAAGGLPPVGIDLVERPGGALELYAWVRAPDTAPADVYALLSDWEELPRWMPNVTSCAVLASTDSSVLVEQRGRAGFLFFQRRIRTVLEFYPEPPHRLRFVRRAGDLARFDGEWTFRAMPGDSILVYLRAEVLFETDLPRGLVKRALRREFARMMPAIGQELIRRRKTNP